MRVVDITSNTIIPIENHFKVSAGPGAGKTYWLVNHINEVLKKSERLSQTRKIACITYTNIAVETIMERLGIEVNQVEVSTIHSFLYKNVVKPYLSFLLDEYKLDITKIDGHNDPIVRYGNVKQWIENHPHKSKLKHPFSENQLLKMPMVKDALMNWMKTLRYTFNSKNELQLLGDRKKAMSNFSGESIRINNNCLKILESDLLSYKKINWVEGRLDHEDVLFFSYKLIEKYPFILTVLRSKFPYFFVDEFQDTNPIQVKLLKMISEAETIVGIIGDTAQSIYSFQGARPEQFDRFKIKNLKQYKIQDNRRSTNKIIDVLNSIRTDIEQNKYRNKEGTLPIILVGERNVAFIKVKELCNNEELYTLSRDNITSNAMKKEVESDYLEYNLLDKLDQADSNSRRKNVVWTCVIAVELAKKGNFKDAIKQMEHQFKIIGDKAETKKIALKNLRILLDKYEIYSNKPLMELYNVIIENIDRNLSNFRKGATKDFYQSNSYLNISLCVNIVEDTTYHRTIHKSKGDEYDNVMLIVDESKLDFLLEPDLKGNEEHRVYYVAISRAKERLFINVPSLADDKYLKLEKLFQIEIL